MNTEMPIESSIEEMKTPERLEDGVYSFFIDTKEKALFVCEAKTEKEAIERLELDTTYKRSELTMTFVAK